MGREPEQERRELRRRLVQGSGDCGGEWFVSENEARPREIVDQQ